MTSGVFEKTTLDFGGLIGFIEVLATSLETPEVLWHETPEVFWQVLMDLQVNLLFGN